MSLGNSLIQSFKAILLSVFKKHQEEFVLHLDLMNSKIGLNGSKQDLSRIGTTSLAKEVLSLSDLKTILVPPTQGS